MSEPRLIAPLLDGYMMGDPISSHDGVRCCPAMQTETENKYIVKIISIPASQQKLDALLLAGAFSGREGALEYFKELTQSTVEEAVLLQRLARLEGFVSYDRWQSVPMEDGDTGFDLYLVSPYRPTLERRLRRDTLTHLEAVNLGLDLCAALSICRRSGWLYVDLKPGNIYICDDREYRIGDLGFMSLASLNYASMPDRYISAYTPPEVADAFSALNTTMDVYAVGMILYQIYNGGELPFEGRAGDAPLPAPKYADGEMAHIILKACDPNPEARWQEPMQMGQALVTYLQANRVNDTPITAPVQPDPLPEEEPEEAPEAADASTEDILAQVDQALEAAGGPAAEPEAPSTEEPPAEEEPADPAETPDEDGAPAAGEVPGGESAPTDDALTEDEASAEEPDTDVPAGDENADNAPAPEAPEVPAEAVSEGAEDAPAVSPEAAALARELGVSEEASDILAQADQLIAHELPGPVVAPEPIDVPIPDPIVPEPDASPDASEETPDPEEPAQDAPEEEEIPEDEYVEEAPARPRKKHTGLIVSLVLLVLAAALAVGGWFYYKNIYLQPILGITFDGTEDAVTVVINSEIRDELLTVFCKDSYGNTLRQTVAGGKASFVNLRPDTRYQVYVEIDGFHKLIGTTSGTYVTAQQTSISHFSAVTGGDDSSVILSFTVQGPETNNWIVYYAADGEEEQSLSFTGHMTAVSGLTVGKTYTFRLEPDTPLYLVGEDTLKFTVTGIVLPEALTIHGFRDQALKVTWQAPEGVSVESWTVRCYNDTGYDKTITVSDTTASFEELDVASGYTVEVTAAGMTVPGREFVSADSVSIHNVTLDTSDPNKITVNWDFEGTTPATGWLLLYTLNGSKEQNVVKCSDASGVISPAIPGALYNITIQPANGNTVFGGTTEYQAPEAPEFAGYWITAENISLRMCRTPEKPDWNQYDIPADGYTTAFAVGESASFAVTLNHEYNPLSDNIVTLFVIRDSEGHIVSANTQSRTWVSMWYRGFGRMTIPQMPGAAGSYTLDIYFNGSHVSTQNFTVE